MKELGIPKSAYIEEIKIPQKYSWEELVSLGMTARELKDKSQWLMGDVAQIVIRDFGEDALDKFANEVGVQKSSLKRYANVASQISDETRNEFRHLSWSHFRVAAGRDEPEGWIERASDNEWTVEQMAVEARKEKEGADEVFPKPKVLRGNGARWYVDFYSLDCFSRGFLEELYRKIGKYLEDNS